MSHIDFGIAIGVTSVLALVIYLVACAWHKVLPPIDKVLEALGFGGAIVIGSRMIYGAFHADELCQIVDIHGKLLQNTNLRLTFGEHIWEIAEGGACIVISSLYSLGWLCRRPSHH